MLWKRFMIKVSIKVIKNTCPSKMMKFNGMKNFDFILNKNIQNQNKMAALPFFLQMHCGKLPRYLETSVAFV